MGRPHEASEMLMSRREVAEWLKVSTRWIERHLAPSLRARVGGRSWYRREDIESQLSVNRVAPVAPPRSRLPSGGARSASRNVLADAPCVDADVREVEAQLRASLAKPTRK